MVADDSSDEEFEAKKKAAPTNGKAKAPAAKAPAAKAPAAGAKRPVVAQDDSSEDDEPLVKKTKK